jgi:hypothetical protein
MNELTLTGPKDVLQEIADAKLSLAKLVPWPEELTKYQKIVPIPKSEKRGRAELMKKYGYDNLYDWCVSNWGTKWDIGDIPNVEVDEFLAPLGKGNRRAKTMRYQIFVGFDSAWSPPVEAFKTIYNKYKDKGLKVYLEYLEPGCCFVGTAKGEGEEFKDDYYEYSNVNDLKDIVKKLDNHSLGESELFSMEDEIEYQESLNNDEKDISKSSNKETNKETKKETVKKVVAKKKTVSKKKTVKVADKKVKSKKEPAKKATTTKKSAVKNKK